MKINDEGSSNAAHWHERAMKAEARLAEAEAQNTRMREAILWALGERGEFGSEPPPLNGKWRQAFWWRTELRERAFGATDSGDERECS